MKKSFLIPSLLLVGSMAFMFNSCKDDDKKEAEKQEQGSDDKNQEDNTPDNTPVMSDTATISGQVNGKNYVDLGLKSGLKWATFNLGAVKENEIGCFIAWGETLPKSEYFEYSYKWERRDDDGYDIITKYCSNFNYGIVDNKTILEPEDDAATANWGEPWRMPTNAEQKELIESCDWDWCNNYALSGVKGYLGKSKINGNIIFLPAAGTRQGIDHTTEGVYGEYLSSTVYTNPLSACTFYIQSKGIETAKAHRWKGISVRAVTK